MASDSGLWPGAQGVLDLGIWSASGDYMPPTVGTAVLIGPRIQLMLLNDIFQLTNTTTNISGTSTKSYSMLGFGLAGKVNFNQLASSAGVSLFSPKLGVTASVSRIK